MNWRRIVNLFLVSRLYTAFWVYLGHCQRPFLSPVIGGWEGVTNWWLNPWTTYDSWWYLTIAREGYRHVPYGFYPLYPLFLKWAAPSLNFMAFWGIFVSNTAFLAGLVALFRLAKKDYGETVAWYAVLITAFFPTTCFSSAVYTESLYFFLLVLCFTFARSGKWVSAGAIGFFSGLTRPWGGLITLALAVEYFASTAQKKERFLWKNILWITLPALAFFAVQILVARQTGNLLTGTQGHIALGSRYLGFPWQPIIQDIASLVKGSVSFEAINELAGVLFLAVAVAAAWKTAPKGYLVYLLGLSLTVFCLPWIFSPHLLGLSRYLSTSFPFAIFVGVWFHQKNRHRPAFTILGLALLLILSARTSLVFGLKGFLS